MNITTHGKDGTRIRFMENEKRRFRQVYEDLKSVHKVGGGSLSSAALNAFMNLAGFMVKAGLMEPSPEAVAALPDQHREEDTEEHEQKLVGKR